MAPEPRSTRHNVRTLVKDASPHYWTQERVRRLIRFGRRGYAWETLAHLFKGVPLDVLHQQWYHKSTFNDQLLRDEAIKSKEAQPSEDIVIPPQPHFTDDPNAIKDRGGRLPPRPESFGFSVTGSTLRDD